MPAVVWTVVIIVLLAVGLLLTAVMTRRPDEGWGARLRELLRSERTGSSPGVLAEHRENVAGEAVGIADLLADAEQASGYITVPARLEQRMEAFAGRVEDRVRTARDHRG